MKAAYYAPAAGAASFRRPMAVAERLAFRSGGIYPLCPRCGATLDREYQNYCDRCGQRLDWTDIHNAPVVTRL